jgi:hypothetical protein
MHQAHKYNYFPLVTVPLSGTYEYYLTYPKDGFTQSTSFLCIQCKTYRYSNETVIVLSNYVFYGNGNYLINNGEKKKEIHVNPRKFNYNVYKLVSELFYTIRCFMGYIKCGYKYGDSMGQVRGE